MCNGVYVEDYLRKEGIEYDSLKIVVNRKYRRDPPRVTEFDIQIDLRGDLSEEESKDLIYQIDDNICKGIGVTKDNHRARK